MPDFRVAVGGVLRFPLFGDVLVKINPRFLTLKQLTHNLQVVAFASFGLSVDLAFVDSRVLGLRLANVEKPFVPIVVPNRKET